MKFFVFGHPNILSTHATTLEFTKDDDLTLRGNCIVGVKAAYSLAEVKKLLDKETLILTINVDGTKEQIRFTPNKDFDDDKEMVVRTTGFLSKRTLGILADKASMNLSRELIRKLQDPATKAEVTIE